MIALTANISNVQNTVYSGLIYWPKYSFFHCVKKSTVYICSVLTTKMRFSGYPNKRKRLVNGNLEPLKTFMLLQKVTVQKPFLLSWPILKWQKIFICKFFFCHFKSCHNRSNHFSSAGCILVLFFYPFEEQCFRLQSVTPITNSLLILCTITNVWLRR